MTKSLALSKRLVCLFLFLFYCNSFADIKKKTSPPPTSQTVHLNPQSLHSLMEAGNNTLMQEMNAVYQAKENVNLARANLLPSVNLGAVISSGPTFALSSITFLVPFLLPSNWLELRESQRLLNAEVKSYDITQLNQFASAYSIFVTVISDQGLRETLSVQYNNLKKIQENVELAVQLGIRPMTDLYSAKAQTQAMAAQIAQVDELLINEKAAVRHMLGLPLEQDIEFDNIHPAITEDEGKDPAILVPIALARAPENAQINELIAAGQADRWSKIFSFFDSATLSSSAGTNQSASLTGLKKGSSFNFGFGYFPTIALSNLNIAELQLRKKEVALEEVQVLESTLGSLRAAKDELAASVEAEDNFNKAYQAEALRYNLGTTDLLHVLSAANLLAAASMNKIKAQTEVDGLRITLNRTMIKENFASIQACKVTQASAHPIKNIFHPAPSVSLDQACGVKAKPKG